jgi:hypothetical protein
MFLTLHKEKEMVASRKLFPVLSVFALSVLGASSAFAQGPAGAPLACTANAGVPPVVRAEGYTELAGDIVVTCTGGNPAAPFNANFQIFLNTNITSRLLADGTTEALLLVDEPGLIRSGGPITPFCVSPAPSSNAAPAACNPADPAATFQTGSYTAFRGARQVGNPENIVVWQGIPVTPPGSNQTRTFRFTNIRANAAGLGSSQTLVPTQITAYISVFPSGTLPLDNPQQTIGYVQTGVLFDVRNCNNTAAVTVGSAFQCRGVTAPTAVAALRFREGFQTAFKPRVIDPAQLSSLPGQVFNSESGFVNPGVDPGLALGVGLATSGTRLAARFVNIPAGMTIFVSTGAVASTGSLDLSSTGIGATLLSTDTAGAGGSAISSSNTLACGTNPSVPAVEVPITSGSGMAVWEVTGSNQNLNEQAVFYMGYTYTANTGASLPALGTAQVIGHFAPFYTTAAAASASSTLPIPRFAPATTASSIFTIVPCQTNLLFPYVTNLAGFDTGIAIANTSSDPFSSANAGAGNCTLRYYGMMANGSAPTKTSETTTTPVAAGSTLTMILSSGGGYGVTGNANFQGYIIATCDFLYAHGFAFITDGPIGQARVAEGYLALVLDGADAGHLRGTGYGEVRGH